MSVILDPSNHPSVGRYIIHGVFGIVLLLSTKPDQPVIFNVPGWLEIVPF